MVFIGIAGYLVYEDKAPAIYVGFAIIGVLLFLVVRKQINDEIASSLSSE